MAERGSRGEQRGEGASGSDCPITVNVTKLKGGIKGRAVKLCPERQRHWPILASPASLAPSHASLAQ